MKAAEVGASIALLRSSAFSSMIIYLIALAHSWSMSLGSFAYRVSKNFPERNPTSRACMETTGCRLSMFRVARANWAMNYLKPFVSPCTTLCKDVEVAATGLQSVNLARNLSQNVSNESTEFLGRESYHSNATPPRVVGNSMPCMSMSFENSWVWVI